MTHARKTVLVVGATGSIGSLVVEEAQRQGHLVRALVRSPEKARRLPAETEIVIGDLTRPDTLTPALEGVDAIAFTHGSDGAGKVGSENVDYGGVRNILTAFSPRSARIALMTAIGVTNRTGSYNRSTTLDRCSDPSQNVKLATIVLGMNETEVRTALTSIAPFYIDQPSTHPDLRYLVAESEAESFAFTMINGKVVAFSVMYILPPGQLPFLPRGQQPTVSILRNLITKQTWAPSEVEKGDTLWLSDATGAPLSSVLHCTP